MIIALGDIYARIPDRDRVRELMRSTQARVREQPGCEYYVFTESLEDPGHFVVTQRWQDRDALERHYRSEPFADFQTGIGVHLVRTSELRVYEADAGFTPVTRTPIEPQRDD
jgi:quinol monooxygenase YgiN